MAHPIGKVKADPTSEAQNTKNEVLLHRDKIQDFVFPLMSSHTSSLNCIEDAAVLNFPAGKHLVTTSRALVEGIHFLPTDPPEFIAMKALRVNVSNLASVGAQPIGYTMCITFGVKNSETWLAAFFASLGEENELFRVKLLSLDMNKAPGPIHIFTSIIGEVSEGMVLSCNTAKSGDRIYVTGTIGDAVHGLQVLHGKHQALSDTDKNHLISRYQVPIPRIFLGKNLGETVHAATDISDGFLMNLGTICRASSLKAYVRKDRIPLSKPLINLLNLYGADEQEEIMQNIWSGGDDYELIFTASPGEGDHIDYLSQRYRVPITCIGHLGGSSDEQESLILIMDENGNSVPVNYLGCEYKW